MFQIKDFLEQDQNREEFTNNEIKKYGIDTTSSDYLFEFIYSKMRLTSYFQPLVILALLDQAGLASVDDIAEFILEYKTDKKGKNAKKLKEDQRKGVEYIKTRLKVYPKQVLRKHGIIEFAGNASIWALPFELYTGDFERFKDILNRRLNVHLSK
tara:strand:+ start:271 stop:735 length:465 start_codon:yes stop_codon:yes gene_type:complete